MVDDVMKLFPFFGFHNYDDVIFYHSNTSGDGELHPRRFSRRCRPTKSFENSESSGDIRCSVPASEHVDAKRRATVDKVNDNATAKLIYYDLKPVFITSCS